MTKEDLIREEKKLTNELFHYEHGNNYSPNVLGAIRIIAVDLDRIRSLLVSIERK